MPRLLQPIVDDDGALLAPGEYETLPVWAMAAGLARQTGDPILEQTLIELAEGQTQMLQALSTADPHHEE